MNKRLLSLMLVTALALGLWLPSAQAGSYGFLITKYVYTQNGLSLNVRESPSTSANVIGGLAFGTAVDVRSYTADGVWAIIAYNGYTAYVQSRYLVDYYPGPKPTTPVSPTSAPASDAQKALNEMNAEFMSARTGNAPFTISARPARASGWVNLRWAPTMEAEVISKCYSGKVLNVIKELRNWYQVQDPDTGDIGFISRNYVTVIAVGAGK